MWNETLIESGKGGGQKKWWAFPVSLLVHALIIGGLIGASYWMVEAVDAPPIAVTLFSAPPPPPPPPPARAAAKPKTEAPKEQPKTEIKPVVREVQPTVVPEEFPDVEEKPTLTEFDESLPVDDTGGATTGGVEGGVVGGVEGGTVGGVEGGVVGGVEGGVIGGVEGGVPGGVVGGVPGGMGEETPMRITAEMKQPSLVNRVEPTYPEVARKARIQGTVILEAVITQSGSVEGVKVLRSLHPVLDQSALAAVRQWRYKPASLNGRPVKVYFTVTVKFTLS